MNRSCKGLEDPPKVVYEIGDLVLSPGGTFIYKIESHPFCRVYNNHLTGRMEPHSYESSWELVEGKWQKDEPNYVSYLATMPEYDRSQPIELTVSKYYRRYVENG